MNISATLEAEFQTVHKEIVGSNQIKTNLSTTFAQVRKKSNLK